MPDAICNDGICISRISVRAGRSRSSANPLLLSNRLNLHEVGFDGRYDRQRHARLRPDQYPKPAWPRLRGMVTVPREEETLTGFHAWKACFDTLQAWNFSCGFELPQMGEEQARFLRASVFSQGRVARRFSG